MSQILAPLSVHIGPHAGCKLNLLPIPQRLAFSKDFEKPPIELPNSKPRFYSHTRSSKGNICIIECAVDGSSVTVANIGSQGLLGSMKLLVATYYVTKEERRREDINGMRLVRQVDDHVTNTFVIPKGTVLTTSPNRRSIRTNDVKYFPTVSRRKIFQKLAGTVLNPAKLPFSFIYIWSDGCKPTDEEGFELSGGNRWEMGANTRTALLSSNGEEKAVYTLRMMPQPPVSDRSITN
ncbi:hypothetical protein ACTXT7_010721 [Hymenolepis weldensis]